MKLKLIFLLASICLFGACALEPKRVEPLVARTIEQVAASSEVDQLLAYMMQSRKLDARELAAEREQMRNTFHSEKSEFNRVKLAMLLTSSTATSAASANDDAELAALLEPLVRGANASTTDAAMDAQKTEVRALAMLLAGMAQERKKLRDLLRETQTRLSTLRRDDTKEMEVRALRSRVAELERNLAALKSIDRSVNRRSETQRTETLRVDPPK